MYGNSTRCVVIRNRQKRTVTIKNSYFNPLKKNAAAAEDELDWLNARRSVGWSVGKIKRKSMVIRIDFYVCPMHAHNWPPRFYTKIWANFERIGHGQVKSNVAATEKCI